VAEGEGRKEQTNCTVANAEEGIASETARTTTKNAEEGIASETARTTTKNASRKGEGLERALATANRSCGLSQ
jgi:hypothetical protein